MDIKPIAQVIEIEKYTPTQYFILSGSAVVGIVNNEIEYLRFLVKVKNEKLENLFLEELGGDHVVYEVLPGGRVKGVQGSHPYPESDTLYKALMGF